MKPKDCDEPHDCEDCPGFGEYYCCQTYGDYHKDYLADCESQENHKEDDQ